MEFRPGFRLRWIVFLWLGIGLGTSSWAQPVPLVRALEQGHSHNDYWRPRPLLDALALGFKSVEADVFLQEGKLLVGHSLAELAEEKTLEALYLKPLLVHWQKHHHRIYRGNAVLFLYIDIKTDGPATYRQLAPLLRHYAPLLVRPGKSRKRGKVQVILTGNYPPDLVLADPDRLVFLDGKIKELVPGMSTAVYPVVSGNWRELFTWQGTGLMPQSERARLEAWAAIARGNGQRIRFWNISEKDPAPAKEIWLELLRHPALLLGTDHLDWLPPLFPRQRRPLWND